MKYEDMNDEQLERLLFNMINGYPLDYPAPVYTKFCTSWDRAMPLAIENGVSLDCISSMDPECGESTFTGEYVATAPDSDGGAFYPESRWFSCNDYEPLRAIVICLIKVLESRQ